MIVVGDAGVAFPQFVSGVLGGSAINMLPCQPQKPGGFVTRRLDKQADLWAQVGFYSSLGFIIPVAVVLSYALGWLVDEKLGTSPVLAIIMAFVGLAGGIWETVRILTDREKRASGNDSSTRPGPS